MTLDLEITSVFKHNFSGIENVNKMKMSGCFLCISSPITDLESLMTTSGNVYFKFILYDVYVN